MTSAKNNVNTTDIYSSPDGFEQMPLDIMGLFYFAYRDFVSDADALLAEKKFGRAHHRVLYFVNIRPGMSVATLLGILKITKQSLARVLRQLIDNDYVEQKTGQNDRRQRLLFPTNKGKDFFATLSRTQAARINAAFADLPDDSARAIRRFLLAMVEESDHPVLSKLKLTKNL